MRRPGPCGFTLVEVLAAMAVAAVAGLLALEVWELSATQLGHVRRAVQDPPAAHVLARLRDDLTAARAVEIAESGRAMELVLAAGGEVEWRRQRGRLLRRETPPGAASFESAFELGLTDSSFREASPGLVEVRLVRRVAADNLLAVGGALAADREELRVEALRVALRGARGGGW